MATGAQASAFAEGGSGNVQSQAVISHLSHQGLGAIRAGVSFQRKSREARTPPGFCNQSDWIYTV
jgi:hypothetical protein